MAVDWVGIRKALRMRRSEVDMQVNELRDKSGVSRTTIYRVENVKDIPKYVIDLDTLDALASAMDYTLADLFSVAAGKKPALTPEQHEGLRIAELWPLVPEGTRANLRGLIESSANGPATGHQSMTQPVAERARGVQRAAGQRRKR